jgi:hypothetical protein
MTTLATTHPRCVVVSNLGAGSSLLSGVAVGTEAALTGAVAVLQGHRPTCFNRSEGRF